MSKNINEIEQLNTDLQKENAYLKGLLLSHGINFNLIQEPTLVENSKTPNPSLNNALSPAEKISLYRSLFRGRQDVYPTRWENSTSGKSGYSPACHHEWDRKFCQKPRIKCSECPNQRWKVMTDPVLYDHLTGKHMIGIYPMLPNDHCFFLAMDFDKNSWQKDVAAFYNSCKKLGLFPLVERSQSGNGAHIWLFFDEAIPAYIARDLGTGLLTLTMQEHPHLSLESYDRLFPNQDTLPKGGFGNLIALPLQGQRRRNGNSTFIDIENNLAVFADPWDVLAKTAKLSFIQVELLLNKIRSQTELLDVKAEPTEEEISKPWKTQVADKNSYPSITEPLPAEIKIVKANLLYIPLAGLPGKLINKIRKLATFQNPEFYKTQAMRLSTFGIPRVINCSEIFEHHIALPRGCEPELLKLLDHYKILAQCDDQRESGKNIKASFQGKLTKPQKEANKELLVHEIGVLSAATGFGKTVIAASVIAKRKVSTLILVHRQQLLTQWQERLSEFLKMETKPGLIGGGKFKPSFKVDVAMMQSLVKEGQVKDEIAQYGQIIVDECHHLSAFSFEQVLKKAKAKYVLGLTATPFRKDGHQPIIFMQCGPIRHQVHTKDTILEHEYQCAVQTQITEFSSDLPSQSFSEIYRVLAEDQARNHLILKDLLEAYQSGRYPLLLTSRRQHLDWFEAELKNLGINNVFIFTGGRSKKTNTAMMKELSESQDNRIILATGQYIGEGFDDPKLDTLILALPISWHGTLQQYVGRLHRQYQDKKKITVCDYIDQNSAVLMSMYQKRLKKYRSMGYQVQ